MLFHSFTFLDFFAVVFSVYWGLRGRRARLTWLVLASAYFYMKAGPWLIGLVLLSASVDYLAALALERTETARRRRLLLIGSISFNLGLLAYFKYVNFFLGTAWAVWGWLGAGPSEHALLRVVLPLGISFYTFETISYIVDVYLRRARAVRHPLDYALYILFFPHLIAGPIVRPRHFLPQLARQHRFNWDRFQLGLQFFVVGLLKKAVLADQIAVVIDPLWAAPGGAGSMGCWLAVLGYAAQIYLDFSGYSDMAVGLAHLLGFRLPANFRFPYLASNIAEFWRRWHISLSTWLRDYLFIPLGGSRKGPWRTAGGLMVTMLLGGLWHGSGWTFVLWGGLHGLFLVAHRFVPRPRWLGDPRWRPACVAATFLTVALSWTFFRAQSLGDALTVLGRLFRPTGGLELAPPDVLVVLVVVLAVFGEHLLGTLVNVKRAERRLPAPVLGATLAGLLLLALFFLPEDGKAFIYFQF
jgi:alginate O-acetyltransferase complex protein AlgI